MSAYLARIELRRRRRSVLLVAVLVALVVATVLTAAAGSRRSRTAFDRLVAAHHSMDVFVSGPDGAPVEGLDDLPHVQAAAPMELAAVAPEDAPVEVFFPMVVVPSGLVPYEYGRPRVIEGRIPARHEPLAVALGERTARRLGVGLGDALPMASYSPVVMLAISQLAASAPRHAAGRLSPAAGLRAE